MPYHLATRCVLFRVRRLGLGRTEATAHGDRWRDPDFPTRVEQGLVLCEKLWCGPPLNHDRGAGLSRPRSGAGCMDDLNRVVSPNNNGIS